MRRRPLRSRSRSRTCTTRGRSARATARHDRATPRAGARRAGTSSSAPRPSSGSSTRERSLPPDGSARRTFPRTRALLRLLAVVPFGVPAEAAAGDGEAGPARGRRDRRRARSSSSAASTTGTTRSSCSRRGPRFSGASPPRACSSSRTPIPTTTPQGVFAPRPGARRERSTRRAARSSSRPWLPYARRADLYAGCGPARFDLLGRSRDRARLPHAPSRRRLGRRAVRGGRAAARSPASSPRAGAAIECARDAGALAGRDRGAPRRRSAARRDVGCGPGVRARRARGRGWREPLAAWAREARVDPGRRPLPAPAPRPVAVLQALQVVFARSCRHRTSRSSSSITAGSSTCSRPSPRWTLPPARA